MASKKDFSKVNTNPLYGAMEDAAADILPGQLEIANINMETQETHAAQATQRKARRTYNAEEAQEAMECNRTSGRKGLKLPRINMAFTPDNYDFVKTMAKVRGETMTDFINHVLELSRQKNGELYEKALEFRNNLE